MANATQTTEFQKLYNMYCDNKEMKHIWANHETVWREYCIIEQTLEEVGQELFGIDIWKHWIEDTERKRLPDYRI